MIKGMTSPAQTPSSTLQLKREPHKAGIKRPVSAAGQFEDHYKLLNKLSKGSFGIVYVTEHIETRQEYAVKVIERSELNEKEQTVVEREVSILDDLRDVAHVVQLVDFYVSPSRYYVVQQFAQGGDVFERLAQRTSYNEKDARDLAVHLLEAIHVLHTRKLAHRDLKPENLLLRDMYDDTSILVADFGFAAYVPPEGLKTRCGTPAFVAPQILIPDCRYDERVDMWSVGCMLYMLISGYPPFQDRNHRGLFRKVRGGDFVFHDMYWKNVSKSAKQLISSMLTIDPKYRCTARMALDKSNWLKMDASLLRENDLAASLGEIKRFHARRTLKSAIHTVLWSVKYKSKSAGEALFGAKFNKGWDILGPNGKVLAPEPPRGGGETDDPMTIFNDNIAKGNSNKTDDDDESAHMFQSDSILLTKLRRSLSFSDVYQLQELLHSGQTAQIYQCYHKKTHQKFAVKIINRIDAGNKKSVLGRTLTETVLHEIAVLDSLQHPNIMSVLDYFEDDDNFYFVLERMYGGDVFDQIIQYSKLNEADAKQLMKSLLEAVAYFHEQGIAHRDLKPQNLLLKSSQDFSSVKITDFGFACRVHTPQSLTSRCGTPSYVAPEVLKNIPYDQSADMWSCGVILYLLLCGIPPFVDENQSELFRKIRTADWKFRGEEWNGVSSEAKDLIKRLLQPNPLQRATAKQALKCRWFRKDENAIHNKAAQSTTNASSLDEEAEALKAVEKVLNNPQAGDIRRSLRASKNNQSNMAAAATQITDEVNNGMEQERPIEHGTNADNTAPSQPSSSSSKQQHPIQHHVQQQHTADMGFDNNEKQHRTKQPRRRSKGRSRRHDADQVSTKDRDSSNSSPVEAEDPGLHMNNVINYSNSHRREGITTTHRTSKSRTEGRSRHRTHTSGQPSGEPSIRQHGDELHYQQNENLQENGRSSMVSPRPNRDHTRLKHAESVNHSPTNINDQHQRIRHQHPPHRNFNRRRSLEHESSASEFEGKLFPRSKTPSREAIELQSSRQKNGDPSRNPAKVKQFGDYTPKRAERKSSLQFPPGEEQTMTRPSSRKNDPEAYSNVIHSDTSRHKTDQYGNPTDIPHTQYHDQSPQSNKQDRLRRKSVGVPSSDGKRHDGTERSSRRKSTVRSSRRPKQDPEDIERLEI